MVPQLSVRGEDLRRMARVLFFCLKTVAHSEQSGLICCNSPILVYAKLIPGRKLQKCA